MHLTGRSQLHDPASLPDEFVLVARTLGPAELIEYDRARLRGVILEEGSPTAHVTIVARAFGIPMVGRVRGAMSRIEPGDRVALDGDNGQIFVRPGEDVEQAFGRSLADRAKRQRIYATLRDQPAVTLDGMRVGLHLNAAFLVDLAALEATGADGIGLYRTELAFMVGSRLPDVDAQSELYAKVRQAAGDKPVVFRTLDVGSDKHLPYWSFPYEENPAMGWRAMRMVLDRPAILRTQLRALIRSAQGRPLDIMFPMVAEVAEVTAAKAAAGDGARARRGARRGAAEPAPGRRHARGAVPVLAAPGAACRGSTSCRSAATICSSSCSPAIAAIPS